MVALKIKSPVTTVPVKAATTGKSRIDTEFPKIFSWTEVPVFDLSGSLLNISTVYSIWLQLILQTALPAVVNQWWLADIAAAKAALLIGTNKRVTKKPKGDVRGGFNKLEHNS